MTISSSNLLQQVTNELSEELSLVESYISELLEECSEEMKPLIHHRKKISGKSVRAMLVLLIAKGYGNVTRDHIRVASYVEMIHAATLIHDDLLDEALERRRLSCFHVEWGAHAAVLFGDWIYATAFEDATKMQDQMASKVLSGATKRVCQGEISQNLSRYNLEISPEEYFYQIDGKTAALFEAAAYLGAYYSSAEKSDSESFKNFGLLAGRAFQIADDLLDIIGDADSAGKTLRRDLSSGKLTLPVILFLQSLPSGELNVFKEAFLKGESVLESDLKEEYPKEFSLAISSTKKIVSDLIEDAKKALLLLPKKEYADFLSEIVCFLGVRDY